MDAIWRQLRYAMRSLVRTPSFTWSVVCLLGLGVGTVTTVFSVVDHVLLQPLPYPAPAQLVEIEGGDHSGPTFERLRTMRTLQSLAGISTEDVTLTGGDQPLRLREARITAGFFAMFGARPVQGRLFAADDVETGNPIVLSYATWRDAFGADPGVVGRPLRVDGAPRVVVGVLDSSFVPPESLQGSRIDLWAPVDWSQEDLHKAGYSLLAVAARLAAGASVAEAQSEADALAEARAEDSPGLFRLPDGRPQPIPVRRLQDSTVGRVRAGLSVVLGAAIVLLLVACLDVAHLFLARGVERTREMSVRRALGASTGALARQVGVESLLLGLAGALVGTAVAFAGIGAFRAMGPGSLPRMDSIAVDARTLGFAIATGLATSFAFGLFPALRLALRLGKDNRRLAAPGGTGTRRTSAMRNGLVVAEIALSLLLAVQAGWLIHGAVALHTVELGFRTADVWTLPLTTPDMDSPETWNRRMQGIRESLAAVPGIHAATFGISLPLQYTGGEHCCWRASPDFVADDNERRVTIHPVDAEYFDIFALRLVAGRPFSRDETSTIGGLVPAIISEPLAIDVFGEPADALDETFTLADVEYTVIGVVADNRHYGPDQDHGPATYIPAGAIPYVPGRVHMAVLADGGQESMPRALARAVWRVEPDVPVPTVRSMEEWADTATAGARFLSGLFTAFGVLSLLLVAGGLAGTLLYTVRLRRGEMGVRLAIGATPSMLERAVLGHGLVLALAGIALGSSGAWASGRLLEGLVAGVESRDTATFGISVAVVLVTAIVSSWVPARRAANTDPVASLRPD